MGEFELHYVRDKQKREVDFLIVRDKQPYALIEAKSGAREPTPALLYFQALLKPKFCLQVVREKRHERSGLLAHPGVSIISLDRFLGSLV